MKKFKDIKSSVTKRPIVPKGGKGNESQLKNNSKVIKKPVKLVDTGCDPIVIKAPSKNTWKDTRDDGLRKPYINLIEKKLLPERPVPISQSCSVVSVQSSVFCDRRTMFVRDLGVQCQGSVLENIMNSSMCSIDPLQYFVSIQRKLADVKEHLASENDRKNLNSVISDLNNIIKLLVMTNPLTSNTAIGPLMDVIDTPSVGYEQGIWQPEILQSKIQKTLEDTCYRLQTSYTKMEGSCSKLQEERDKISLQLFQKIDELDNCLKRENELKKSLHEVKKSSEGMARKLDEYHKSVGKLQDRVKKLEENNKKLEGVVQKKENIEKDLKNVQKMREQQYLDSQLMKLEMEKFKTLVKVKSQEIAYLHKEIKILKGVSDTSISNDTEDMSGEVSTGYGNCSNKAILSSKENSSCVEHWKGSMTPASSEHYPMVEKTQRESRRKEQELNELPLQTALELKNELRNLFCEIKKQTELFDSRHPNSDSELS